MTFSKICGSAVSDKFIVSFLFFLLGFSLYSSAFPPGLINLFLVFLVVFACLRSRSLLSHGFPKFSSSDYFAIGLLVWILLSSLWSGVALSDALMAAWEFRFFILLPLLGLFCSRETSMYLAVAIVLGGCVSLIASYSIFFSIFELEGGQMSLGNRIFHGFTISIFSATCFYFASLKKGVTRAIFSSMAILGVVNLLFVEAGRTGYLQAFVVVVCAVVMFKAIVKKEFLAAGLLILMFFLAQSPSFVLTVDKTINNVQNSLEGDLQTTSAGLRLSYYTGAIGLISERPILGYGVGGVESALERAYADGNIIHSTDNVHNELLNMWLVSGALGLFLFLIWMSMLFKEFIIDNSSSLANYSFMILAIFFVSILFNSTIKDFGEKHALLVALSLLKGLRLSDYSVAKINQ